MELKEKPTHFYSIFFCKKNKDTLDKTMFQRFITHRMHASQLSGVSL